MTIDHNILTLVTSQSFPTTIHNLFD